MTATDRPPSTIGVAEMLRASGELAAPDNGSVGLAGRPLRLLRALDATFLSWAEELGAEEWRFPAMISRATLESVDFFSGFSHLATSATPIEERGQNVGEQMLSTAVCFHLYPQFAGQVLPGSGPILRTAAGECYRYESGMEPLRRQWAFTMREIVFLGTPEEVESHRRALMARTCDFARRLQLDSSLDVATDPFFTAAGRGRALLQRIKELKYELHVGDLAVASFNNHEAFFGRAFDFHLEDGRPAHSGCVAFGLERWVYALMDRHGMDFEF